MNNDEVFAIEFVNPQGGLIGRLKFEKDRLEFEGSADESAKTFLTELKKQWEAERVKS
jgi:hypothetical protein